TRAMKKELDQRKQALEEASKDLERTSTLREDAAASAQKLEELTQRLTAALTGADERATSVGELSTQLEDRVASLRSVEKRFAQFEERLSKWTIVDQEVAQSLEQIVARQGTIEAIQADLDRMFVMAEETAAHVRGITSAHQEIEGSRELLATVMAQLQET